MRPGLTEDGDGPCFVVQRHVTGAGHTAPRASGDLQLIGPGGRGTMDKTSVGPMRRRWLETSRVARGRRLRSRHYNQISQQWGWQQWHGLTIGAHQSPSRRLERNAIDNYLLDFLCTFRRRCLRWWPGLHCGCGANIGRRRGLVIRIDVGVASCVCIRLAVPREIRFLRCGLVLVDGR